MVGEVFRLKIECLGNPINTIGVCYQKYPDFDFFGEEGLSIIFPNGNYAGFSFEERVHMVEFIRIEESLKWYVFTNVIQLSEDFRNGIFNEGFRDVADKETPQV